MNSTLLTLRAVVTLTLSVACAALAVVWPGWLTELRAQGYSQCIPNGDVAGLIAAINAANATSQADTICLAPDGVYTLTAVNNTYYYTGPSGLPWITSRITINGNGATIRRTSAAGTPDFRIFEIAGGDLTLDSVTIMGGRAAAGAPGYMGGGGGVRIDTGTLLLVRSTITDNYGDNGGGILNFVGGTLTVVNSTISRNTGFGGRTGGGILNFSTGGYVSRTTIINSTIFENRADGPGGFRGRGDAIADAFSAPGSIVVKNSILASPTQGLGGDCYGIAPGVLVSRGHNIASDASCVALTADGDLKNTNPLLGPLADNGGPTPTHAPLLVSPARGAVPLADLTDANGQPVSSDQRGVARPQGTAGDIGSVEAIVAFVVNSPADGVDAAPGNGACAAAPGVCTLRAAIMEANAYPGAIEIGFDLNVFNVPRTITLGSPLPAIAKDLTITGPGGAILTVDAAGTGSVLRIDSGVTADISGLTVTGGSQPSGGGGIRNGGTLTLTNVTVSGNTADFGAGIYNDVDGTLTVNDSTVSGNTATVNTFGGGGIFSIGIGRTVTLNGSTVSGNTATGVSFGTGGGLYIYHGRLILNNSTVSGNRAKFGGGIATSNNSIVVTLNNSTITANTTTNGVGGGLRTGENSKTIFKNTIVGGNPGIFDCDISGTNNVVTSLGHNLDSEGSCGLNGLGDVSNPNPLLGPLADNGGPTRTHAPLPGSPALDAVPLAYCTDAAGSPVATDQRGVGRPQGGACDRGSVEWMTPAQAAQATQDVITAIASMGLEGGVANALSAPLDQVSTLLNDGNPNNDGAACGKLGAFENQVDAKLKSGKLTPAQASQLLNAAGTIKASLGC